jgi:negative regulator of flagellin synthesis FlgM
MKIENTGSQPISRPELKGPQAADGARSSRADIQVRGAGGRDQLTLSDQAQVLARARAALNEQPEIRAEKVEELRQSVEAGTYQVPHEKLVRRLMARLADTL